MSRRRYHPLAIGLHWIIFALILIGVPIGVIMVRREFDALNNVLYTLHWSIGLTVLALMVLRLATRLLAGPPKPAAVLTPFQKNLSHAVHIGIYVMLFVAPILGWLGKSAYGASAEGISIFYLFHVPTLIEKDEALAETLLHYHAWAVWVLLGLLALHIAGGLYHALIAKDGVAGRMGLGRRTAEPEA